MSRRPLAEIEKLPKIDLNRTKAIPDELLIPQQTETAYGDTDKGFVYDSLYVVARCVRRKQLSRLLGPTFEPELQAHTAIKTGVALNIQFTRAEIEYTVNVWPRLKSVIVSRSDDFNSIVDISHVSLVAYYAQQGTCYLQVFAMFPTAGNLDKNE
ncbi:hypothetical protein CHS0354_007854, partial [Potamilus streckersoni]